MARRKKTCFVIMPFLPELHYFYLYLKDFIEKQNFVCYRADDKILTVPILDKIINFIQKADVIIADCTGRNPNVFYELGIAHNLGKKVILITKDEIKDAPSDIKHYEFIKYELEKHVEFFYNLENALTNVFVKDYEKLYKKAEALFNEFKAETGANVTITSRSVFISYVSSNATDGTLPDEKDVHSMRDFLLPKIVKENMDSKIMASMTEWLGHKKMAVPENKADKTQVASPKPKNLKQNAT